MSFANVTRPCAFVFLRSGSRVLVSEMTDPSEGTFYRPPGGGIEFGETSQEAGRRELQEEFGIEIDELTYLGVIENVFEFRGAPHHEICFIFEAWLGADDLDGLDGVVIVGTVGVEAEVARIFELDTLREMTQLYPGGVRDLFTEPSRRDDATARP